MNTVPGLGPYSGPPVAVVGNGPVGQTVALLLARWGIPTIVLDARPGRDSVGSKAICQQRDVLDIWESVGAGRQIAEEGVTWSRARTYYGDEELTCIELAESGSSPFPPFVNISQSRTEEILDERIALMPLVSTLWSHEVVAVEQSAEGLALICRTPRGEKTVKVAYAVVCGGGRADALRRSLGVTFLGRSFEDRFLICDIRAELPGWEAERRFYFDPEWNPGRQVLIHPCPDSTYRIDWQVPAEYDLAEEERTGALDLRIRRIVGDTPYELVWRTVYRFHSRIVDRMRVGRVLIAGDCAHLFAPFGARGLNSGVQDAENAAWKLAFVLRGWADRSLLDSYDAERHAAARENLEVTGATMSFLVPQTDSERVYRRDVLERARGDAAAQSLVDSGRLAEPYWYVDSPLTTPDPSRPFPGRPPRGQPPAVVPGVLLPDTPVGIGHLHELARNGLLVLATEGVDAEIIASSLEEALAANSVDAGAGKPAAINLADAPHRVVRMSDVDLDGSFRAVLGARPREVWLIRPDAHIAAILVDPSAEAVRVAVRRVLGR